MIFERIAPEQHDTLDGVPEPSETPFLIGHSQAAGMLTAAYRAGKLPHALIFSGPVGIGKATLAFHLAHHLLKHPDFAQAPESLATPDPASSLFRQIATGAHPGVLHLTRPLNDKTKSFKTVVTVDEIRKVNRFLSLTSHDGSYRVVIVDPADDMNTNAANALLKNLEEPPARTLFILIVHAPGSLLPTIRSRCQVVRLTPLDAEDLMAA
ncbi:DNA polymerase III subunit delta', partial [Mesorhizobium sp.]|uniref:DNA polymerase III subunit delta' n=1 Tax=Mesorhizobium sp. TaxID=1871066 RepID=UPI001227AA47